MNDTGVLPLRPALRSHAVVHSSIRVLSSVALVALDLPVDGVSTRCEGLTDCLDRGATPCPPRARRPRCTATAAKIPIPT
jgi:hypothetical protein